MSPHPRYPDRNAASHCYDCGKEHHPRVEELLLRLWDTDSLTEAETQELNDLNAADHEGCFQ